MADVTPTGCAGSPSHACVYQAPGLRPGAHVKGDEQPSLADPVALELFAANAETSFSSFADPQFGQVATRLPRTSISNRQSHARHTNSKSGISSGMQTLPIR